MAAIQAPFEPAGGGTGKAGAIEPGPDRSRAALWLLKIKSTLEHLGGMEDRPTPAWMNHALFWGIWWAALILIILAFSGQTSKFIYIDF